MFDPDRYTKMKYRRSGRSGLLLPEISLGLWHNFGTRANHDTCRAMVRTAFDLGICHFDLANNYGPEPGSAEERFGNILKEDFSRHRDELIISSKAGYYMWPGPYGEWGSKKYLVASIDQSLKRMGLDYVDIFYSHRPDPNTPLEETLGALDLIVRQGKALYAGVSSYRGDLFVQSSELVQNRNWTPITLHQPRYNMFDRGIESDLLEHADTHGTGVIVFSPLEQGLLSNKYLDPRNPIPKNSRAADPDGFLQPEEVTVKKIKQAQQLNELAEKREQSLTQMALAWTLRDPRITSAIIGARTPEQIMECVASQNNPEFTTEELITIDEIVPR